MKAEDMFKTIGYKYYRNDTSIYCYHKERDIELTFYLKTGEFWVEQGFDCPKSSAFVTFSKEEVKAITKQLNEIAETLK